MTADIRALWYRSWLETHRPFRIGFMMMIALGFGLFMQYGSELRPAWRSRP